MSLFFPSFPALSISSSLWIFQNKEYWIIYRGPGFLAVLWFGSSPTPYSPSLSVSSTGDTREDKRDNLLTGEGGRGGWARGKSNDRKEALSSINHSILSISGSSLTSIIRHMTKPLCLPGLYIRTSMYPWRHSLYPCILHGCSGQVWYTSHISICEGRPIREMWKGGGGGWVAK